MREAEIRELPGLVGEQVRVSGWLYNARSSGKLRFLVVRDGSGYLQVVVFKDRKSVV
jgi:asparaginyl-tRNA synthetase